MSTKKLKTQLMAAVAMVLVAAIALGTATFAWFAMNNKVTATGMSVTTQVSNNLFIAEDTLDGTAIKGDSDFKTSLVEDIDALLEPVSTINPKDFFYTSTKNVQASGDAVADKYVAYNPDSTTAFDDNYGTTGAVGYVDYVFQLKAINTMDSAQDLKLTKLDLTYGDKDANGVKAFRAGVFVKDLGTDPAVAFTAGADTVTAIYAYAAAGTANFDGKAVNSTTTLDTVTYNAAATQSVAADTTNYYQVIVRLWLEGEDKNCNNNTFTKLTDEWNLNVGFELGTGTAVSALTTAATAAKADLSSASVGSDTVKIDGVTYTKISVQLNGEDLYVSGTALNNTSRIFVIEDDMYPLEVTNQCKLPTA